MFWRRKPPGGEEVSDEYAAGMRAMEAWYHEFVIWAYAYISLLEKQLKQGGCMENKMDTAAGLDREAAEINRAVRAVLLAVEDVLEENEGLKEERDAWVELWTKEHNRAVKAEAELRDERDRFDRLSDFELAEAKKLESSLRAVESSGWISVEDRLPDRDGRYLLCGRDLYSNDKRLVIDISKVFSDGESVGWNIPWMDVTHWMPLPEPPEDAGDGKGRAE